MISRFPVNRPDLDQSRKYFGEIERFRADRPVISGAYGKVRRLFSKHHVLYRHGGLDNKARAQFLELARNFDVVWFHRLKTADTTGIYHIANAVLDMDDFESEKFMLEASITRGLIQKAKLWWRYALWRQWEQDAPCRFQAICVCSQGDRKRFVRRSRTFVLPNGFEPRPPRQPPTPAGDLCLGFVGPLRYHPNLDGICWFLNAVLPILLRRFPKLRIRIAGEPPDEGHPIVHPNVDWLGFVDDVGSEMAAWKVLIVPLRIGGGTRIKILEALSRRCPVVSTALGAYGLELKHGRELLIADRAEDFAECCMQLLKDSELSRRLVEAGWQQYVRRYTWGAIQPAVESVVFAVAEKTHRGQL
jgi:glycosyltransferase involved in cell wall biosynthesis